MFMVLKLWALCPLKPKKATMKTPKMEAFITSKTLVQ